MESFVRNENIKRFRKLRDTVTDPTERGRILKLLAEEEAMDSRRPAETSYARAQHNAVLSKHTKHKTIDCGVVLILAIAGITLCGLVIGVAWGFGLHQ